MGLALTIVQDIYLAMEQANIGKLFSLLDQKFEIHGPAGMDRKGRGGILDMVATLHRREKGIKKEIEHFIEHENMIIVLGNILFGETISLQEKMAFVDIWKLQQNRIDELQLFFQDPLRLVKHLKTNDKK